MPQASGWFVTQRSTWGDAPSCGLLTERQQPEGNALCTTSEVLVQMAHKQSGFWNNLILIGELG